MRHRRKQSITRAERILTGLAECEHSYQNKRPTNTTNFMRSETQHVDMVIMTKHPWCMSAPPQEVAGTAQTPSSCHEDLTMILDIMLTCRDLTGHITAMDSSTSALNGSDRYKTLCNFCEEIGPVPTQNISSLGFQFIISLRSILKMIYCLIFKNIYSSKLQS